MFVGMSLNTDSIQITPEILSLIAEIDEFKGAWKALGTLAPERLSALRRVATIESIGSSTRIEGSKLSDSEVDRLLSNIEIKQFETRDEQEVAGYAEAIGLIFDSAAMISLTENHIKQLHRDLLRHSEKDARHRGEYKSNPNHVSAFDEDGHAIFTVVFLEIHPFQDGNGRLSRILTTLILLRSGYEYAPYSSLESVIEQSKEGYYLALRRTQGTIRTANPNWQPWLVFFLRALQQQKARLHIKMEREKLLMAQLPPLSVEIIDLVQKHGSLKNAQIVELTGANRNTVKKHLADLVATNHLQKQGIGKGTVYVSG